MRMGALAKHAPDLALHLFPLSFPTPSHLFWPCPEALKSQAGEKSHVTLSLCHFTTLK